MHGRNKIAEDIIAGLSNRVLAIPKMLDELTQTERYAKGEDHVNAHNSSIYSSSVGEWLIEIAKLIISKYHLFIINKLNLI